MKLFEYRKPDGSFDYATYRANQIAANHAKIDWVWAVEENLHFVGAYIARVVEKPRFGICHGTRRGKEQEWLSSDLGCEVIGTEISDTASQFAHTIRWDFHDVKPEWIDAVDFIYSNSFDHSYDPGKCLRAWMSCVRRGGVCVLEHTSYHGPDAANAVDPFGAELTLMPYLIATWAEGQFGVREILKAPAKRNEVQDCDFVVVQRF